MIRPWLLLCALLLSAAPSWAETPRLLNKNNPGQRFETKHYITKKDFNIFVFHSEASPKSVRFVEEIERRFAQDRNLSIGLLTVDRESSKAIDWRSPLSQQYRILELPYVVLYEGKTIKAKGHKARKWLLRRLYQES